MTDNPWGIYEENFGAATKSAPNVPPALPPSSIVEESGANAKLTHNLGLALDRQKEILTDPVTADTDLKSKRLVAEVAHQVVKTAVQADENRLRARKDNVLAEVIATMEREKTRLQQQDADNIGGGSKTNDGAYRR